MPQNASNSHSKIRNRVAVRGMAFPELEIGVAVCRMAFPKLEIVLTS